MKKIISLITAAIMAASSLVAIAAPEVNVVVNDAKINFADQAAVIENDRTLIPARGVFEAMGCKVEWDGEARTVSVKNSRNTVVALLTIDSDKMNVTTYTSLFDFTTEEITLDVPAQIMNDRTMIPLRAVGEAMGAKVAWDSESYTASILTDEGEKADAEKDKLEAVEGEAAEEVKLAVVSISQAESENEDEVVISVDLKGMELYPESYVAGVTATLAYDKEVLEFKSAALCNGDANIDGSLGAQNPDFREGMLKVGNVTVDGETAAKADGSVMKLVFKKLKAEKSEVSISAGYDTKLGYDTSIVLGNSNADTTKLSGTKLIIDETPIVVE